MFAQMTIPMHWLMRVCLVACAVAIWIASTRSWMRSQRPATLLDGEITHIELDERGESPIWRPTIRYSGPDGLWQKFTAAGALERRWEVGDLVWVYLDGNSPRLFDPSLSTWRFVGCLGLGAFLLLSSCAEGIVIGP